MNAYVEEPDQLSTYTVLIDPSGLSGEDESRLEDYSESRGLRVVEAWGDWGPIPKDHEAETRVRIGILTLSLILWGGDIGA